MSTSEIALFGTHVANRCRVVVAEAKHYAEALSL